MRPYQYVLDHCEGIDVVLHHGVLGEAYNVGPDEDTVNLDMTHLLLDLLGKPRSLIQFVADRPGHDRRYSLNSDKIKALGWRPAHTFEQAMAKTVRWYVENEWWWRKIKSGEYKEWYRRNYGDRAALVRELHFTPDRPQASMDVNSPVPTSASATPSSSGKYGAARPVLALAGYQTSAMISRARSGAHCSARASSTQRNRVRPTACGPPGSGIRSRR